MVDDSSGEAVGSEEGWLDGSAADSDGEGVKGTDTSTLESASIGASVGLAEG